MITYKEQAGQWQIFCDGMQICEINKTNYDLENVKLRPDSEVLISFQYLAWSVDNTNFPRLWEVVPIEFESIEGKLTVKVNCNSKSGILRNETTLVIEKDEKQDCVTYDVSTKLKVLKEWNITLFGVELEGKYWGAIEATDPYFHHVCAPGHGFEGFWNGIFHKGQECHTKDWRKRWKYLSVQLPDGFKGFYHNHTVGSATNQIVAVGGIFGHIDDELGDIIYELKNKDRLDNLIGHCPWGFDVHISCMVELPKKGAQPFTFQAGKEFTNFYKVKLATKEESEFIKANTVMIELDKMDHMQLNLPLFTGRMNKFDMKNDLSIKGGFCWSPYNAAAPDWDWSEFGNMTFSSSPDSECGYDDNCSLKMTDSKSCWTALFGQENWCENIEELTVYTHSFMAKGESGSKMRLTVGYAISVYKGLDGTKVWRHQSKDFELTEEWQKYEFELLPTPNNVFAGSILIESLSDTTMNIDNYEIENR